MGEGREESGIIPQPYHSISASPHWDSEEQTKRTTRWEQLDSSCACELGKNGHHSKATQLSEV